MVATMTVTMPAMMFVMMPAMTAITVIVITVIMAVMAMVQQCTQRDKSNCRTHDAVVMMRFDRCTGQHQHEYSTANNHAKFVYP